MILMRTVLQVTTDEQSEIVVYLDKLQKAICTQIHIRPCLVHIPTTEAERYQHVFVPPEELYEPERFEGVIFVINIATLHDVVYAQLADDSECFGVF